MADKNEKKKDPLQESVKKATGSRAEKLGFIVEGAKKKYGRNVLHPATETEALIVPRASTGLYGLDCKTNGGLPLRRVVSVYGPRGGGKTALLLRGTGNAQSLCANCWKEGEFEEGVMELPDLEKGGIKKVETQVITACPCGNPKDVLGLWVDAEGVWLPSWSRKMGMWPEKILLMRPSYGEQAFDTVTAMVNSGEIDIIAIDSLAALSPAAEVEASMEQAHQGVSARMNNKFVRKVVMGMNNCFQRTGNTPALWYINQYREKIGVMFGSPEVLTGGKGQLYATTLEIELRPKKMEIDKDTGEAIDQLFGYNIKKNKVGVLGGRGEYKVCLSDTDFAEIGDLLEHESVIDAAVNIGLVDRPSKVTYEFNGEKFRGKSALELYLIEHEEEYEYLKDKMLKFKLGIEDEDDED